MKWDIDEFDGNGKLIILYRFRRIIEEGIVKSGDRVLDVGGWGKLEYRLTQEGCKVDMLNIDKAECDRVAAKYGTAFNIINADIRHANIESETYDVVTCFETLEHIMEDRERAGEGKTDCRLNGRICLDAEFPGEIPGTALQQDSRDNRHQMIGQKLPYMYIPPQQVLDHRIYHPHGSADIEKNIPQAG